MSEAWPSSCLSGARTPTQEEFMRNRITLIPIAAFILAACGDKRPHTSDATAGEVSPVSSESASASAPTPAVTGPVSFEDANTAFKAKRYDEAARLFATYTTAQPDNVWGHYMLGLSAWKAGDRDRAVEAFRHALEQDSTHVKSHLNLTRVLLEQGKPQDALSSVEAALKIDSASSEDSGCSVGWRARSGTTRGRSTPNAAPSCWTSATCGPWTNLRSCSSA